MVITAVTEGSPAQSLGFHAGDLVLSVNNQKIAKTGDLDKASRQSVRVWRITVVRSGQQINVTLGG